MQPGVQVSDIVVQFSRTFASIALSPSETTSAIDHLLKSCPNAVSQFRPHHRMGRSFNSPIDRSTTVLSITADAYAGRTSHSRRRPPGQTPCSAQSVTPDIVGLRRASPNPRHCVTRFIRLSIGCPRSHIVASGSDNASGMQRSALSHD